MILKRHIAFKLRPYGKQRTVYQIQLHVTYDCNRVILSTGCQVTSLEAWDPQNQWVVSGFVHKHLLFSEWYVMAIAMLRMK